MSHSEPIDTNEPVIDDPIIALRNEFSEQFATLKASFEQTNKENNELIAKLKEENDALHRALVRSALNPEPVPVKEKTEEEIYNDRIKELANRTIELMKR